MHCTVLWLLLQLEPVLSVAVLFAVKPHFVLVLGHSFVLCGYATNYLMLGK